jgi:glyoxylase-like metal-dependent hydrolase (beta-lactamase superfamily II)
MKIKTLTLGPMDNNTYIVSDEKVGECILIDPSWNIAAIETAIKEDNLKSSLILLTHGHYDHSKNLESFLVKNEISVLMHEKDVFMLEDIDKKYIKTFNGDYCFDTKSFSIGVICTPGHSIGSCCYRIGNNLFTGDTLFVGQCGRVDFPYSDPEKMYESLIKLSKLNPSIKVFPGHMPQTSTIAKETKTNPYIKLALKGKNYFLEAMG